MTFRKNLKKYTLIGMVGTVFFIVFFIIPVEIVTEDRGGGRTVDNQKTLIQVLLEPEVDIEIDVGGETQTDGFQNEFLQNIVDTIEPSQFCKIYPDSGVC